MCFGWLFEYDSYQCYHQSVTDERLLLTLNKTIKSIIMKNPEEEQNIDDREISEADDQESQKDIHSNGYEPVQENNVQADKDILEQSYRAAESAHTLNPD